MSDDAKLLAERLVAATRDALPDQTPQGIQKGVISEITALLIQEAAKVGNAPVVRTAIYKLREAERLVHNAIDAQTDSTTG
jgi:hypothetical protein